MKERPILFSGPLVRALLREVDPKTMTRRLTKEARWNHRADSSLESVRPGWEVRGGPASTRNDWVATFIGGGSMPGGRWQMHALACPFGAPGDRLWVRETSILPVFDNDPTEVIYAADYDDLSAKKAEVQEGADGDVKWRPSIHMPRWASRIDLEVTAVRVERLNEIPDADIVREGLDVAPDSDPWSESSLNARNAWRELWDSINGARASWASNPWVWVVSFRRVRP